VAALARVAAEHRLTVVHVSSDYVFDGEMDRPYREDDAVCPLGVYGQSKAAGDAVVGTVPRQLVVRTSWVIGEGANFVSTMARLARAGAAPAVVDDQVGRPTFAADLAGAIGHLLGGFGSTGTAAPYGLYDFSNDGPEVSWFDLAREVFRLVGAEPSAVRPVSTAEYMAGRGGSGVAAGRGAAAAVVERGAAGAVAGRGAAGAGAPRPRWSVLDLAKIKATGLTPRDWRDALREYLAV
jgi:dTDP-4-dehydrorhamnose 3,5-epimerase